MASSVRGSRGSAAASNAAAVTISADDLFMLKQSAHTTFQMTKAASEQEATMRASRKAASEARAANWGNTLAGQRKAKTQARFDAIEAKEAEQKLRDEEATASREAERQRVIDHARQITKSSNENMQVLERYRQHSHTMDVLKKQAELKAEMAAQRRKAEEAEYQRMLAELQAANAEEQRKMDELRGRARQNQIEQQQQLDAVIKRRMAELKATEEEGRQMLEATQKRAMEDMQATIIKRDEAARKAKEFAEENARLLAMRAEIKKSEAEMMAWITQQAERKQAKDRQVKDIIERQRLAAIEKAKIISSIMEADYNSRKNTEDTRLAKEVAEGEAKAAAAADEKARKQAEMRAQIDADIKATKDRTLRAIKAQMEEDAREHDLFVSKLREMEEAEARQRDARRAAATKAKEGWLAEAAAKASNKEQERLARLEQEKHEVAVAAGGEADAAFYSAAERLLEEERQKGHDVQHLMRTVYKATHRPIMPNLRR